jgi:hypothetical protein
VPDPPQGIAAALGVSMAKLARLAKTFEDR